MSDEANVSVEPIEGQESQESGDIDFETRLQAMETELAERKKTEAGLHRAISESQNEKELLRQEVEDQKKAAMTDSQRRDYELEQKDEKIAQLETHQKEVERKAIITNGLATHKLDPSVMGLMREPQTEQEMESWAAMFEAIINPAINTGVNERLAGTPQPKSGNQEVSVNYQGKRGEDMSKEEFYAYLADTI